MSLCVLQRKAWLVKGESHFPASDWYRQGQQSVAYVRWGEVSWGLLGKGPSFTGGKDRDSFYSSLSHGICIWHWALVLGEGRRLWEWQGRKMENPHEKDNTVSSQTHVFSSWVPSKPQLTDYPEEAVTQNWVLARGFWMETMFGAPRPGLWDVLLDPLHFLSFSICRLDCTW